MKAKFAVDHAACVVLSYDAEDFGGVRRVQRTFACPVIGGRVSEYINGDWKQVCERLSNTGQALHVGSREKLIDLIRREYQAMRRAEKREAKSNWQSTP